MFIHIIAVVVSSPVLDEGVGEGEPLGALLAGEGLLVELLHVEPIDPVRREGQVAAHAAHGAAVAHVNHLEATALLNVGRVGSAAGGQGVGLQVPLQRRVDLEVALALVALVHGCTQCTLVREKGGEKWGIRALPYCL